MRVCRAGFNMAASRPEQAVSSPAFLAVVTLRVFRAALNKRWQFARDIMQISEVKTGGGSLPGVDNMLIVR